MADTAQIIDVTRDNIQQLLQTSQQVPVLIDFWAEWCQPCRMLMPILAKLADEYAGRFVLAKVNTEQEQEIAAHFGIRSIPVVKLLHNGQLVDEFMGALPEAEVRQFLDKHIPRASDNQVELAHQALSGGDFPRAKEILTAAAAADPDNPRIPVLLAQTLAAAGDPEQAKATLAALPDEQRQLPEVQQLTSRLEFAELLAGVPPEAELNDRLARDDDDQEARLQLALRRVGDNRVEDGLELLLDLMRRDRGYGDDAARKTLLKVFDVLGDDPLVTRYRARMATLLH